MRPLAITAHYDDMEIGAGGTMSRFAGINAVLYPTANGATQDEARAATSALGIQWDYPMHYDGDRELVAMLDRSIQRRGIDTIITCSPWDSHPDHRQAASIAQQVARIRGLNLLYMDLAIPGGTTGGAPKPNLRVAITPAKYDALACYRSQVAAYGDGWIPAVRGRDEAYGWVSGVQFAEGFVVADWSM